MSGIFNVLGKESDVAYDNSGKPVLSAFDINGEQRFGYGIENVQPYFRADTLSVASQVNDLGDPWQSFVFCTDPHYPTNRMHSQQICLYLLNNSKVSMLVLGGDYCEGNWFKSRFNAWTEEFQQSKQKRKIHCLFGNHERFGNAQSEALSTIYSAFLADKKNINGSPEKDYYYFDDSVHKTRYMFINTSDADSTRISDSQLAWIRQNVQLPDATWSLVVLGHVNMMVGTGLLDNKADLISAIESCNGSIVGYICGHQHLDAVTKISDGFYELTLLCDRFAADEKAVPREDGTITEQAVTVVSFNTATKQVVARRIGAGNNKIISYTYA